MGGFKRLRYKLKRALHELLDLTKDREIQLEYFDGDCTVKIFTRASFMLSTLEDDIFDGGINHQDILLKLPRIEGVNMASVRSLINHILLLADLLVNGYEHKCDVCHRTFISFTPNNGWGARCKYHKTSPRKRRLPKKSFTMK